MTDCSSKPRFSFKTGIPAYHAAASFSASDWGRAGTKAKIENADEHAIPSLAIFATDLCLNAAFVVIFSRK